MTRFARAKGSKSSNLKSPEDSTPWEVMKEHMLKAKKDSEECKKREEAEQQRIENYNNFLKEHKVQKRKATWCDFPEAESNKKSKINSELTESKGENKRKQIKDKNNVNNLKTREVINPNDESKNFVGNDSEIPKKKKKNNKKNKSSETVTTNQSEQDTVLPAKENNLKISQNKKKNKKKNSERSNEIENQSSSKEIENVSSGETETGKKKKNKLKKKELPESKNETPESGKPNTQANNVSQSDNQTNNKQKKNAKPKRRKPINDKSFQLIINGKEVKLVRFDGFPIMKKDADRLEELKKSMVQKGIPKSEVQRTMKLERRRAEKALARMKREVCYNCRKGGHNLSDCPDLKSNIPGAGISEGVCFKCGSTEHRQFECKVQRDKEFRFATCFICKESGHIARQCPDNPKGLYPNGGCCKLCGDVTHLRKDCPTVKDQKEETSIKLQTLYDDNVEDIGYQAKPVVQDTLKKPKRIKF